MKRIKDEELRIDLYTFTYSSFLILHFYSSFLFFIFLCFHLGFFRIVRIDVIDRS